MTTTSAPHMRLRADAVRGAMAAKGLGPTDYDQLATLLGVSPSTVKRVMTERQPPSSVFIAACKLRLGLDFALTAEAVEKVTRRPNAA